MMPSSLTILKHLGRAASCSRELRYLFASCVTEAGSVFDAVREVVWQEPMELPDFDRQGPLLVLGAADTFLGHASLERMWAALRAGADVVLPHRLDAFDLRGQEPVYSLRGFERLERRCLDELEPPPPRSSHLPVALFAPALVDGALPALSAQTLFTDESMLTGLGAVQAAAAGVFHEFADYFGQTREDVLEFLPQGIETVLEVGCGRGFTGRMLQERLGCRVTGIEINEVAAAEAARHLWRVHCCDVRDAELEEQYDAVLATELLEHLAYPEEFLVKMKQVVRPGGRVVLSLPNVGHYSIVEDLIAGRWDYLPIGLLCYTHLRFFTKATLESWLRRAGFSRWQIHRQTTELPARIARLATSSDTDIESLQTKGFHVVIHI